ncbi:phage tail assembly protein [Acetobacteraceae bacterium]|nr:phage tail assembly protein [Acetobacteraceae bacterium]
MKISLDKPIGGKSEINLSEPTFHAVMQMAREIGSDRTEEGAYKGDILLFSLASGLSKEDVEKLPTSKFDEGMKFLKSFEESKIVRNPKSVEVITLDSPIASSEGNDFQELKLREPTVRERRRQKAALGDESTPESYLEGCQSLVMDVSGWPLEVVREIPISKFWEAVNYLVAFFQLGQETGSI